MYEIVGVINTYETHYSLVLNWKKKKIIFIINYNEKSLFALC